ncbi:MAG: gliding motility-associated C-terminal domain-containing protein [Cyclobacteriaceae bacterium]|nr:gliding motility-associated C-terminal domain-containing protein [Cyclobacteriaceae bacterium]
MVFCLFSIANAVGISFVMAQQVPKMTSFGRGYLEYLPPGYSTTTDLYPCIIFLHGSGERGAGTPTDLQKVTANGPPKHIKNGHTMCFTVGGKTECFIVLSPQTNKWSFKYDVIPFVDYALANYRIDPARVYLTGLSMGGEGTWFSAGLEDNDPNRFAAISPIAGQASTAIGCTVANRKIPVWAFHGDADTAIPISGGQRPIDRMIVCGANPVPIFTIYPGVGHGGAWDRAYRTNNLYHTPNLYEWFLTQKLGTPVKQPPVVSAGSNKIITLPTNSVTVTGTASDPDGTITSTVWVKVSGPNNPTLVTPNTLSTQITGLIAGSYTFSITATDNDGLTKTAQVNVTVNPLPAPIPPVANAGGNKSITAPVSSVILSGSGTDADGTIIAYLWKQESGPNTATLSGITTTTLTTSNLIVGSYTFSLTVTDNSGLTGSAVAVVSVLSPPPNNPPTVSAGSDRTITLPVNSLTVTGTATDSDGSIASILWTQNSGPSSATITTPGQLSTSITNLIEGVYQFTLSATDNLGSSTSRQVTVTVLPKPPNALPVANAGSAITITLPVNTSTLNGSGTDADGSISSYAWIQTSGPGTATIVSPGQPSTVINGLVEGNYVFTLTVTDNDAGQGSSQVIVKVLPMPPNQPPVADAGTNQSITLPSNSAQLTGNGTDSDGTIAAYQWTQVNGPSSATILTAGQKDTQVSGLVAGIYTFQLSVTDDKGATGFDQVTVSVFPPANQPPVVNAGTNTSITLPTSSSSLSGTASDPDGTIASYLWEQVSGPKIATLISPAAASTNISALTISGIYVFSLTVKDNNGASASAQASVTVLPAPPNQPPNANAGSDVTVTLPVNSAVLTGTGTDADGTIVSYHWNFLSGPATITLSDVDVPVLTVSDLLQGIYVFELVVADNQGATDTDEVRILVNAALQAPVASTEADKSITLPTNSVILSGSGTDADGTIVSYDWTQSSGPDAATFSGTNTAQITVSNLLEGIYIFTLTVTDNDGITDSDQIRIVVNPLPPNSPPVAITGPNQTITLPQNSVIINGGGTDADGTIVAYAWTQISGPSTPASTSSSLASITFSNLQAGTYVFRLIVTDNGGAKGQKDIQIKVNPQPINIPPVVNAGVDKTITLPVNIVSLNGSGSDPDGTITLIQWSQMSGPSIAFFTGANNYNTNATNLVEGIYVFRLSVTDNSAATSVDEVIVTVKPIPYNLPPIANAGGNKVLTLPQNNTTLSGSGTDEDGVISIYTWSQLAGPSTATTSSLTNPILTISGLAEGIYLFRLTVTDDKGSTGFDEVNIRVQPLPANQPPTANGGGNKVITLPINQVTFNGSGSDPDGSIASFQWTQQSGPSTANLSGPTQTDLIATNLIEGTYIFRLTVTDDKNEEGYDEVNVRVNPPLPNVPPIVSAGINTIITLPTNSLTITATVTDSDGTISSILWSQVSGPANATLSGTTTPILSAQNLVEGIYLFRITATDNNGGVSFDEVSVTVKPVPANLTPTVNAGPDKDVLIPPATVVLSGTATDADGTIASTVWTQVSGPSVATFSDVAALTVTVTNLTPGVYNFRLTATDNLGGISFDEATITVKDNIPPTAFTGEPVSLVFPENSTRLTGGGVDPDGIIENINWNQISGPTVAQVTPIASGEIDVTSLAIGFYVFELTVVDNNGAEDKASVSITVVSPDGNQAPIAFAGDDNVISIPETSTQLMGSGEDSDGIIISYLWEQITGPAPALILSPADAHTEVHELQKGAYSFKLTVSDNGGLTDADTVKVDVIEFNLASMKFPKIFSPNGDNSNDFWTWEYPSLLDGCALKIYNQLGKKVFETVSYQNTWDGTSNGKPLEEDAYYYIITCSDGNKTTGGVRIVR